MTKKDFNFWLGALVFFLIYTFLMAWMQKSDEEAARVEAFGEGLVKGMEIEASVNEGRNATKALQWWVGSDEIGVVRERLCHNYNVKGK